MKKNKKRYILFLAILSLFIGIFYFFFNNFSLDNNILFLSNKLFLGNWLRKGVFPFFNPYIYAGTPFAFDIGLGNFHPMNLLFLFPFPFSYALWVAIGCFLFLFGFFLFFSQFASLSYSLLLTIFLFFSGSGLLRLNNPTIFAPITHLGLFMYSLRFLGSKEWKKKTIPYIIGILLLLFGHLQIALYCFIFALCIAFFLNKISLKKLIIFSCICFFVLSWYFVLSLPIILESTRRVAGSEYNKMGSVLLPQLIQFIFPTFFGALFNGSSWFVGSIYFIISSFYFTFGLICLAIKKRLNNILFYFSLLLWVFSLGIVPIPLLRGSSQIIIFIHILYLILFAKNEILLKKIYLDFRTLFFSISFLCFTILGIFFVSPLFSKLFLNVYLKLKHIPSLYYDGKTIHQIGILIALSFFPLILFSISGFFKKRYPIGLLIFAFCEGLFLLYVHNYYVPNSVFIQKSNYGIDTINYRVQTAADVVPFFGYRTYNANILLKPPFSKEIPYVDKKEESTREKLKEIIAFAPGTWSMVAEFKALQGFNTFLPMSLYTYFKNPSEDYREVYANIIARNNLFGQTQEKTSINDLELSTITLYDKRWENLRVRYFLSPTRLNEYSLIKTIDGMYVYENNKVHSIYEVVKGSDIEKIVPKYEDPNKVIFLIGDKDVGKTFEMSVNPGGFVGYLNGKKISVIKKNLLLQINIKEKGELTVFYSPLEHLKEDLPLL